MLKTLLRASVLLSCVAVAAPSQRIDHVAEGARVRITSPFLPAPLFGRVTSRDPTTGALVVSTPGGHARVSVPLDAGQRVDVSRGRPRFASAAIGAGAGFLIGSAVGIDQAGDDPEGFAALAGLIAGGGTGLIFGAVLGYAYAPERWHRGSAGAGGGDSLHVTLSSGARVRRFADGTIAVKGERDRRRGIIRGAAILGGIGLVFGGIDASKGRISHGEYVGTIAGNTIIGGALGYLVSPRGWQRLPAPRI